MSDTDAAAISILLLIALLVLARAFVDIARHAVVARDIADGDEIDETFMWIPITIYRDENGVLMWKIL